MSGWITFQSAKLARVDQFSVGVDRVSDVGNQDLPWRHRSDFHRAGFEQVGMAIETLKTVERLVIGPFGLHQQTVLGQYPKQSVPPDRQPSIVLALQQIMLLVDAHP